MAIRIDYRRMIPPLGRDLVESYAQRVSEIHRELQDKRRAGMLPFYELPYQDVSPVEKYASRMRGSFKNLLVLGIGGSALGLSSLNAALRTPFPALERDPRLVVLDNIDPLRIASYLEALQPRETLVNVITKSGDTAETMSQFLIFRKWLVDSLGAAGARERIIVTTDAKKGALRQIANEERLQSFEVPDGVGGRFSVLTSVGLLPAALLGMDVGGLLAGAARMDKRLSAGDLMGNPAYLGAVMHHLCYQLGRRISVMFSYSDQLYLLADWYRQLWAESLGKRLCVDGSIAYVGPTPVKALGVTDQHSQVQLYKEGPDDKVFTFITVDGFPREIRIPAPEGAGRNDSLSYLGVHSINELFAAEESATEAALWRAGRPVSRISFPIVDAGNVAEYYYFMEVQTVAAGALFRIDPLDQPGVEEGKHFAYGIMGRKGFESRREELESLPQGDSSLLFRAGEIA
jgi:glucose-6-phosphate isomerase